MIGSSSNHSIGGFPMNQKAAEAELISKATQTAIIAARSILMSGGTEESALKTAKAAAESVLNPAASDSETVSGRSTLGSAFGGRKRKARRQAEVVASMALMSATSLHPNGNGMSECDSLNKMYGRNIITVKQDEPSVLSGSTRPPKPPTPKSFMNQNGVFDHRSQQEEIRDPSPKTTPTSSQLNQASMPSPTSMISKTFTNMLPKPIKTGAEDSNVQQLLNINTLSQSTSVDSERESSIGESSFLGRTETEDDSDEDTSPFFFQKKEERFEEKSKQKGRNWTIPEALLSPLTATLNMLHCGQITGGDAVNDVELMEESGGKSHRKFKKTKEYKRNAQKESFFDSRDDTFDDETTNFSFIESPKKKGAYRDPDFATSYSYTSSHSEISDDSDEDSKVRNSIRNTMECIVNKSRTSYRKDKQKGKEKQWKSFETKSSTGSDGRRSSASRVCSPKNSSKNKRPPRALNPSVRNRARSFFKRDKGRR